MMPRWCFCIILDTYRGFGKKIWRASG